jgi:hypothetical protein
MYNNNFKSEYIVAYRTLLGNDHEKNNEVTVIDIQQLRKYATVLGSLLGSGPRATMEVLLEAVFSMWFRPCPNTVQLIHK